MVLGLRSKTRKESSVQVDFIIYIEDLKPWPPSKSLKSVRSVFFVWENGEQNSGSFVSDVGDASVLFNESITLQVTLARDRKAQNGFQKNILDFYLYEPRNDKSSRGQLLGTCIINLADFVTAEKAVSIRTELNCKKSSRGSEQPCLFITIHAFHKGSSNSSPKGSLSNGQASVADSVNEENDDGCEFAAFTDDDDDDASFHSSQNVSSSALRNSRGPPQHSMNGVEPMNKRLGRQNTGPATIPGLIALERSSLNAKNPINDRSSSSKLSERSMTSVQEKFANPIAESSSSSTRSGGANGNPSSTKRWFEQLDSRKDAELLDEAKHFSELKLATNPSQDDGNKSNRMTDTLNTNKREHGNGMLNHSKSLQPNNTANRSLFSGGTHSTTEKTVLAKSPHGLFDRKNEWKVKVEMLEEELRETAVLEVSLYSVVADHTSSSNKMHAPARRLSRFYLQACKMKSRAKQASAAQTSIAGLVLVSKACGNDVPRLTFWLSNSVMLRAIVSQGAMDRVEMHSSITGASGSAGRSLNQRNGLFSAKESKKSLKEDHNDWEDVTTFVLALEQLESWLFSRIVESVWWQTLTPHMQTNIATTSDRPMVSNSKKGRKPGLGEQEQGNFSIELWKKAFKDACERLCPVRAGGHECGCLPVIAKLIMEQLVRRLDVAMFNAVLRESDDDMPTDPVSDPISDAKVLPIPPGKSSFSAGAQLKNAIGNWSRWLSNLFGIEENEPRSNCDSDGKPQERSKPFGLLNELSDLMMLPFEMVADPQTRKEVCPTFSPTLVKRVLCSFVPDEFCQKPIPQEVFDALDTEDDMGASGECLLGFPCSATPIVYSPPHAASSLAGPTGDAFGSTRSLSLVGSASVVKRSYTSDDELDELDSPFSCIMAHKSRVSPGALGKGTRGTVRYQLLRQVWRDVDEK